MLPRVNLIRTDETDYLMFSTRDSISLTMYMNGYWAKPLLDIAAAFLDAVEAPFMLDIGANLGAVSVPLGQRISEKGGVIFAYEPQRIIYYQLCGNILLNRLQRVYAFNLALGEQNGEAEIPDLDYGSFGNIGAFSLDPENPTGVDLSAPGFMTQSAAPKVPLLTLDSIALPKAPALIKIDVEGMELQVLKGATETLVRHGYPPLMLESWLNEEHSARRIALESYLLSLGYQPIRIQDEVIAQHPAHTVQIGFFSSPQGGLHWARTR